MLLDPYDIDLSFELSPEAASEISLVMVNVLMKYQFSIAKNSSALNYYWN